MGLRDLPVSFPRGHCVSEDIFSFLPVPRDASVLGQSNVRGVRFSVYLKRIKRNLFVGRLLVFL